MQLRHARVILLASLCLLILVVFDVGVLGGRKNATVSQTPSNLTDAIAKLGKVIATGREVVLGETSTESAAPKLTIKEPADKFETSDKAQNIVGNVSDYTATISAKLNDRFLGIVKVSSTSGDFTKEIELSQGKNTVVLSAVASTGATAVASVSGTLLATANAGIAWVYVLLFVLALLAGWGLLTALKRPKKPDSMQKPPTPLKLV